MRTSQLSTWALVVCCCLFFAADIFADQRDEFEKLPAELAHVKIYQIAIPVTRVEPKYPRPALEQSVETDVWLKILISKTGTVLQAGVVHCPEKGLGFEYAARTATMEFTFEPILKHGEPQTCWCYVRVPFRLPERTEPVTERLPAADEFVPVDQPPEIVEQTVPVYPEACAEAHGSGFVWVKALVDRQGVVRDVVLARSSGSDCGMDQVAMEVARLNKYKPAVRNGQPVAVWVTFKVEFVEPDAQQSE